jgi:hypothetical protein
MTPLSFHSPCGNHHASLCALDDIWLILRDSTITGWTASTRIRPIGAIALRHLGLNLTLTICFLHRGPSKLLQQPISGPAKKPTSPLVLKRKSDLSNIIKTTATHSVSGPKQFIRFCALAVMTSSAVALADVAPVSAATTGTTTATVTVTGGALAITVPSDSGSLGSEANAVGGTTISGQLGEVHVSDARSAVAGSGWIASAISTAFTPTSGPAIGATNVGYTAGSITKVGTATYTANDPASLVGVAPVVTATGITGDNSATWNPTITVAVPGGIAAGTYEAIVTHSLL